MADWWPDDNDNGLDSAEPEVSAAPATFAAPAVVIPAGTRKPPLHQQQQQQQQQHRQLQQRAAGAVKQRFSNAPSTLTTAARPASAAKTPPSAFSWDGFEQVSQLQAQNALLLQRLDAQQPPLAHSASFALDGDANDFDDSMTADQHVAAIADGTSGSAAQRIGALAKKNRELTAKVGLQSAKIEKLTRALATAQDGIAAAERERALWERKETKLRLQIEGSDSAPPAAATATPSQPPPAADNASKTVLEMRNENTLLRKDLALAVRALEREVGEGHTPARVMAGDSKWKGRAEQITGLKTKLAQMQQQLLQQQQQQQQQQQTTSRTSTLDLTAAILSPHKTKADERNAQALKQVEHERKAAQEGAAQQLEALRSEHALLLQKSAALKARNQGLGEDLKTWKSRCEAVQARLEGSERAAADLRQQLLSVAHQHMDGQAFFAAPSGRQASSAGTAAKTQPLTRASASRSSLPAASADRFGSGSTKTSMLSRPGSGSGSGSSSNNNNGGNRNNGPLNPVIGPGAGAPGSVSSSSSRPPSGASLFRGSGARIAEDSVEARLAVAAVDRARLQELSALLERKLQDSQNKLQRVQAEASLEKANKHRAEAELEGMRRAMREAGML